MVRIISKRLIFLFSLILPATSHAEIRCNPLPDGTPTSRVSERHGVGIAGVNPGNAMGMFWNTRPSQRNYGDIIQDGHLADSFSVHQNIVSAISSQTEPARLTIITGQVDNTQDQASNDNITVGVMQANSFTGSSVVVAAPQGGFSPTIPTIVRVPLPIINNALGRGLDPIRNSTIIDFYIHDDTQVISAEFEYCVKSPIVNISVKQCCSGIPPFASVDGPWGAYSVPRFYESMQVVISIDSQNTSGFHLNVERVDPNNFTAGSGFQVLNTLFTGWVNSSPLPSGFVVQNYTAPLQPGLYQLGVATGPSWTLATTYFYVE